MNRFVLPVLALAALLIGLAACGGGSAGVLNEALTTADNSFIGVESGDFKAVRYNDSGYRDAVLNSTIDFTSRTTGNQTIVTVAVSDDDPMVGVAMDLHYDASRYNPVSVEFAGLIDTPVEFFAATVPGVIGLAQADLGGFAVRSGDFVSVAFEHGPAGIRTASVVHTPMLDTAYDASQLSAGNTLAGFSVVQNGNDWDFTQHSIFAAGDGDDNGETNAADISAIVIQGNYNVAVSDSNYGPAATDYDGNGEVNAADIQPIALNYTATVDHIDILLDDAADMDGATIHSSPDFASGVGASRGPAPFTTASWDPVWRTWTGTITLAEIQAADTDADGTVYVSSRTSDGSADGAIFAPGLPITGVPSTNINVTDFDVEITNATGGSGAGGLFIDGDTASAVANSTLTLNITGISGNYDPGTGPVAFTPADAGGSVPQDEYDDALALVQGFAMWDFLNAGDAEMRMTTDVITPLNSTGSPVDVAVFPDDDFESDAATPEATLQVSLNPAGGPLTAGAGTVNVGVDVTADPEVPIFNSIFTSEGQDGNGDWLLNPIIPTEVAVDFTYGTIIPVDLTATSFQLFDFNDPAGHINCTYTTTIPPAVGQFTVTGTLLTARVAAPAFAGHEWAARFTVAAGKTNSVNSPGEWITTGPPPPSVDFVTVPMSDLVNSNDDFLSVLYPDPIIRRDGSVSFDDIFQTVQESDSDAYFDVLKNNGFEFTSLGYDGPDRMPRLVLNQDPIDNIGPGSTSQPGVILTSRGANKCVIDIAVITAGGGGPGDPDEIYNFKLFDASDNEVGRGSITVAAMGLDPAPPTGFNWGINIYDDGGRGTLTLGNEDWTDHTFSVPSLIGNTPDTLFLEFADGRVSDWPPATGNDNTKLVFEEAPDTGNTYEVPLDIRVGGIGTGNINYIAIHPFAAADMFDPIGGGPGILTPGSSYHVQLDDTFFPGSPDWESTDLLTVTN